MRVAIWVPLRGLWAGARGSHRDDIKRLARAMLLLVVTILVSMALPSGAQAVSYGIADSGTNGGEAEFSNVDGTSGYGVEAGHSCADGSVVGTYMALTPKCISSATGQPGKFGQVRFFVRWDTVGYSTTTWPNSASCAASPDFNGGNGTDWKVLVKKLQAASADGLTPLIAIQSGSQDGTPLIPDPNDYYCGVSSLMYWLTTVEKLHVGAYEVYNEPDLQPDGQTFGKQGWCSTYNADFGGNGGSDCAAYLYLMALLARNAAGSGDANDTLAIGTFSSVSVGSNCCGYIDGYFNNGGGINYWVARGYQAPSVLALHPYEDVDASGWHRTEENHDLTQAITEAAFDESSAYLSEIWVTEAAAVLTSNGTAYASQSVTCTDGDPNDADRLAACTDENSAAQAYAAQGFMDLASGFQYIPVTRLYWYEFQPDYNWDSGLIGPYPSTNYDSGSSMLRPSYCVLYGWTVSQSEGCNNTHTVGAGYAQDVSDGNGAYVCQTNSGGTFYAAKAVTDADYQDLEAHSAHPCEDLSGDQVP